jgi:glycosyltransferase involved in cell wall biosynthesis
MKVSVIVPAYRLERYIGPCLEGLIAQVTNFDFEVIVCDDKSPDGTLGVIRRLASGHPRLKVLENDPNRGLVATMRRLLEAAQGDYIAYLDGDDLALPGKLQAQADYLDANPGCGIVYHESEIFESDSGRMVRLFTQEYFNQRYIPARATAEHLVRFGTFLQASSPMVRRHANLLGALDHSCRIICDYPWHLGNAMLGGGTIDFIPEVFGRYRIHSESFGAATNRDFMRREEVASEFERACEFAGRLGLPRAVVDAGIMHVRFSAALYFLRAREDARFARFIEASQPQGQAEPFDERHAFALAHAQAPDRVRDLLGWANHD